MMPDDSPNEFPKTRRPWVSRVLRGEARPSDVVVVMREFLAKDRDGESLAEYLGLTDEALMAWTDDDDA